MGSEASKSAKEQASQSEHTDKRTVAGFLERLAEANIKGIGRVTVKKLVEFAKSNGYI